MSVLSSLNPLKATFNNELSVELLEFSRASWLRLEKLFEYWAGMYRL